jgi:hypothetical protein
MAPKTARFVDAGPVQEPVQPSVEPIGASQGGQIAPGADERLLDRVLRLVGVMQDQTGCCVQPPDRGAGKRGEGVMIASSRPVHEIGLHHVP